MPRFIVAFGMVICSVVTTRSFAAERLPAQVLDLSHWKLTLPISSRVDQQADEVQASDLSSFSRPNYFFVEDRANAVVFRAYCGGATTKGSSYPRCELREMADQTTRAAWSTDGKIKRTLTMHAAINNTPSVKPHVVCAQIHDADDDLLMVRLEGEKLLIERNSFGDVVLDARYKLGTAFELQIQAGDGRVKVWYGSHLKMNWEVSKDNCYFKAGCYTQSNINKGDAADSYGEVVISRLHVANGDDGN